MQKYFLSFILVFAIGCSPANPDFFGELNFRNHSTQPIYVKSVEGFGFKHSAGYMVADSISLNCCYIISELPNSCKITYWPLQKNSEDELIEIKGKRKTVEIDLKEVKKHKIERLNFHFTDEQKWVVDSSAETIKRQP